jgi:hypothetical protein
MRLRLHTTKKRGNRDEMSEQGGNCMDFIVFCN